MGRKRRPGQLQRAASRVTGEAPKGTTSRQPIRSAADQASRLLERAIEARSAAEGAAKDILRAQRVLELARCEAESIATAVDRLRREGSEGDDTEVEVEVELEAAAEASAPSSGADEARATTPPRGHYDGEAAGDTGPIPETPPPAPATSEATAMGQRQVDRWDHDQGWGWYSGGAPWANALGGSAERPSSQQRRSRSPRPGHGSSYSPPSRPRPGARIDRSRARPGEALPQEPGRGRRGLLAGPMRRRACRAH